MSSSVRFQNDECVILLSEEVGPTGGGGGGGGLGDRPRAKGTNFGGALTAVSNSVSGRNLRSIMRPKVKSASSNGSSSSGSFGSKKVQWVDENENKPLATEHSVEQWNRKSPWSKVSSMVSRNSESPICFVLVGFICGTSFILLVFLIVSLVKLRNTGVE